MRIISLKWKALWGVSLVLFTGIAVLSWLSYSKLVDQVESSRAVEEAVYVREIHALLKQSDARLQQLASWVPRLEGMAAALAANDGDALQRLFGRHWPAAQLDYDLQSAAFHSPDGTLVGRWHDGSAPPVLPADWVERVARDEQPLFTLACAERCFQVAVLPLLVSDRTAGVLVLGASIAELIVRFREVTGRDIGVLIRTPLGGTDAGAQRLESWGVSVVALSDAPNRLSLLRSAAARHSGLPSLDETLQVEEGGRHYAVKLFPLDRFTAYGRGHFVVLSDVTESVARVRHGARNSLVAGVVAVILSELVLFWILSAPLTRLQRTARALPLLAQNGFDQVRSELSRHRRQQPTGDEIDYLDETALELASRLGTLNEQVEDRTEALRQRMRELERERGFVSSLLDTAQVVILTQNRDGRIGLANRYALKITGYDLADLVGKPFVELLGGNAAEGARDLSRLLRGDIAHYSHETELICATGRKLQLAWFHSSLSLRQDGGAAVLSAGLDITERKHAERRIAWLADHDPLTGLVNRRRFEDVLQSAMRAGLERNNSGGALMYVDLDQFKMINDTLGHASGDRVLEAFSGNLARMGDSIVPGRHAVVARLGGDEFAVILEDAGADQALAAADRLREGLNRMEYKVGNEVFRVTCSIGVALYPQHGLGLQELMQNADLAMYQAKALGEGRVQMFTGDEAMRTRMAQRLRWKERIDEALDNDRFRVYFQPILDLASGEISHYEALVRMLNQDAEPVPPSEFIPVAESTGQITAIDCRVLDLVFSAWRRFMQAGIGAGVHINLSARAFQTPEWWHKLDQLLAECDADPSNLVFEITETAAVTDLKDARSLMEAMQAKGCRFALDDFGVGFSSFNYVKELPVDLVKIDGAFIVRLAHRRDSQLVVKALVDVARGFGKRTVAEFADSEETLAMLKQLKVDYAQGYHIGKPVPEEEVLTGAGPDAAVAVL